MVNCRTKMLQRGLLFWGLLLWATVLQAAPEACGIKQMLLTDILSVIWGFLTGSLAIQRLFNPSLFLKSCKHRPLPSERFFNLNFKADRTSWLISQDIKLSIPDTQNYLLDLETRQCTSRICEVWCKSSHHYTNTLKKASHRLNKRFFLHLWHFSMSMNRSLSSLHSSSPHYPLWQESSSTLFLPFSTPPPPPPWLFLPSAQPFHSANGCSTSQLERSCAHIVGPLGFHLLNSTLLLSLQAQCPRGYKAQSYSIPTWIKYAHCQHFLQQPGTLFIFARHRAE